MISSVSYGYNPSDTSSEIEKESSKEYHQIFLRQMHPNWTPPAPLPNILLDTWPTVSEYKNVVVSENSENKKWTVIFESELDDMFGEVIPVDQLPEVAQLDANLRGNPDVIWIYKNEEWVWSIVRRSWEVLTYGKNWVFLKQERLADWEVRFIEAKSDSILPTMLLDTGWSEKTTIEMEDAPTFVMNKIVQSGEWVESIVYSKNDTAYTIILLNGNSITVDT